MADLHDRMAVIPPPFAWLTWVGENETDTARLKAFLVPYPAGEMTMWPVDKRVSDVKNDDPSLIEPVALA